MEVFQEYQRFLSYAFDRPDPTKPKTLLQKYGLNIKTIPIYYILSMGCGCLFLYLFNGAETLQDFSETVYALTTLSSNISALAIFEWQQKRIFGLIDDFQSIIEKRIMNPISKAIYKNTNEYVEKLHRIIFFGFTKITFPCITIPFIGYSYFLYFFTDQGENSFFVPFKAYALGISWKNPYFYLLYCFVEFYAIYHSIRYSAIFMCYPIGTCYFMSAFGEDIVQDVITLNKLTEVKENKLKVYQKLCSLVELHSTVKQLTPVFKELYQFPLTIFFLWSVSTIASTLVLLQIEILHVPPNISNLVRLVFLQFWAFISIFLICELGDRVMNRFSDIDIYFLCEWHLFPANVRRILPMVLMNTQLTVALAGYGNVPCSRETFKMISHGGFSYFMIIRQFIK